MVFAALDGLSMHVHRCLISLYFSLHFSGLDNQNRMLDHEMTHT